MRIRAILVHFSLKCFQGAEWVYAFVDDVAWKTLPDSRSGASDLLSCVFSTFHYS